MRKILPVLTLLILLTALPLTAFAGDIPESLLYEDTQIFLGEVLAYHPNKETPSISVSPLAVARGDVPTGTQQHYTNPHAMGGFRVQEGKVYLFTYYNDSDSIDLFEVTTYNTKTLKLRHVEGSMWDRFEKYLNEGKYGEAKVEGLLPYRMDLIYGIAGMAAFAVILISVTAVKKKRKR